MIEWNPIFSCFVLIYLAQALTWLGLEWLNQHHLLQHGGSLPAVLNGIGNADNRAKMAAYACSKSRFRMVHKAVMDGLLLAVILSGLLPGLSRWLEARFPNDLIAGLLFFWIPGLVVVLLDIPFSWYHTFGIEARYGFNLSDTRTWVLDQAKGLAVTVPIVSVLLVLVLQVIAWFPRTWWPGAVAVFFLVQLALTVLYPVLIAPLFNRFEPIRDDELRGCITELITSAGVQLRGLYQMDASRRNRHSNAYFTGLGRVKRIVLFDTLLNSHPRSEILAVLAHELGHYRKRHVLKQVLLQTLGLSVGFRLTNALLSWAPFYRAFQFDSIVPYAGLFLAGILWQRLGFFAKPLFAAVSRSFEREADRYAVAATGGPEPLTQALRRLAADNLSNLAPHPLYISFHYTHPPLAQRLEALNALAPTALHPASPHVPPAGPCIKDKS